MAVGGGGGGTLDRDKAKEVEGSGGGGAEAVETAGQPVEDRTIVPCVGAAV